MDSAVLLIQRTDRSAATLVLSITPEPNEPQAQSKLVFHRDGNRYFRSRVWLIDPIEFIGDLDSYRECREGALKAPNPGG